MEELCRQPMVLVPNRIIRGYPGGREIEKFRGNDGVEDDRAPEAWVGSTTYTFHHKEDPNSRLGLAEVYIKDGKKAYLKDVLEEDPESFLGKDHVRQYGPDTALLVKLLDAQRQLGLQTHPDRSFAKKMFQSDYGKVESWYIIGTREDQEEEPYVLLGFKEGVSREKFQELFLKGDIRSMEKWCHRIPVSVGDMFFVDAGVPHAIGPGCFLVEVQEPSDITVGATMREFDDPQETEEYIEKTMGCYHYIGRSYEQNLETYRIEPKTLVQSETGRELLLLGKEQTPFFSMTQIETKGRFEARDTGTFSIVIVTEGEGRLLYPEGSVEVKRGDELFLPAALGMFSWEGDGLCAVRCYPPGVL